VPAGATPKDGPERRVANFPLALVSLLTAHRAQRYAMTVEFSLPGPRAAGRRQSRRRSSPAQRAGITRLMAAGADPQGF